MTVLKVLVEASPQLHQLPLSQEAGDPLTGRGWYCELSELLLENFWDAGVEC